MIYIDESFQGNETILCAVVVPENKTKLIITKIRETLNKRKVYKHPELKLNKIKINYDQEIAKAVYKKVNSLSDQILYVKETCKQHSLEFYSLYSRFLEKIKKQYPNERIMIDKFSGHYKVNNYSDYSWGNSSQQSGLQLADIALYGYSISKDIFR